MDDFSQKISSILNDPSQMDAIKSMVGSLGISPEQANSAFTSENINAVLSALSGGAAPNNQSPENSADSNNQNNVNNETAPAANMNFPPQNSMPSSEAASNAASAPTGDLSGFLSGIDPSIINGAKALFSSMNSSSKTSSQPASTPATGSSLVSAIKPFLSEKRSSRVDSILGLYQAYKTMNSLGLTKNIKILDLFK